MTFEIEINNKPVKVKRGETILEVLNRIGIKVPTLCSMKDFVPTGMCRLCVVELEGRDMLIPSCSFKVEEWMKIKTHSPRVILARKTIIELLLANHPDDCLYCERNGNCELQQHAEDMHVRERRIVGGRNQTLVDKSSIAIIHEPSKCILCGRCVRICSEQMQIATFSFTRRGIGTSVRPALDKPINSSNCIFCGQCVRLCPTAALADRVNFSEMQVYFHDPHKKMAVTYSPAVAAILAEHFNFKTSRNINAVIHSILRKIGFEIVFDTSMAADVMMVEMCGDFLNRIKQNGPFPMFTSSCPAWVKYVEQSHPQFIKNLCTAKSFSQLAGVYAKHVITRQKSLLPDDIYLVSILPCTAAKFEASRPQMTLMGISDIDSVITVREFIRMINMYGIDVHRIITEINEDFSTSASVSGKLVNISGGTTEMFLKTLSYFITGQVTEKSFISTRLVNKDIREFKVQMGDNTFGVVVVNGMSSVPVLMQLLAERQDIHFVEVMACNNACMGGGGLPLEWTVDTAKRSMKYLLDWAETDKIKCPTQNVQLKEIYKNYLNVPMPSEFNERLHTYFVKRDVFV
ncbi:MAG: 2Fe-2S iron-sulfur cluster-binding protein [Bacteroidales bacterium]|nr:2Fe-2S iron-sulfur cluster-binding protein [Bacteroidales bacterium]